MAAKAGSFQKAEAGEGLPAEPAPSNYLIVWKKAPDMRVGTTISIVPLQVRVAGDYYRSIGCSSATKIREVYVCTIAR
jgi:hypothetical protein